ncbi:Sel1-like protein [Quillaja saponaria]|uniref:Sel1-like protein n=1 Tax=Quillaja saponaria TaxID=32244 RepID=A0AAD7LN49_QUISA|nr:Sel1-like protein [Quillaja saponaria]
MESNTEKGNKDSVPLSEVVSDCANRWFKEALKEAKAGNVNMQVLVGQMYHSGYGVSRDDQKVCFAPSLFLSNFGCVSNFDTTCFMIFLFLLMYLRTQFLESKMQFLEQDYLLELTSHYPPFSLPRKHERPKAYIFWSTCKSFSKILDLDLLGHVAFSFSFSCTSFP